MTLRIESYRCDNCGRRSARCDACRAKRAAARARRRAERKAAGLCTECPAKAYQIGGRRLTLCRTHALQLTERSNAAHKRARADARGEA
jgi:hypothetical protein